MFNERNTEIFVRYMLREQGYYDNLDIIVEEQSSKNIKIDKLIKSASKTMNETFLYYFCRCFLFYI